MNSGVIYRITNPSFNVYIGQTWNLKNRFSNYKKLNCKFQTKLFNSFKKYGFESHKFEIIFKSSIQQELDGAEIFYIEYYKSMGCSLNIRKGGSQGKLSDESKQKISISRKGKCIGEKNSQFGKERSDEHRKRLSISRKGKGIGKENSQFGKERSDEHRKRLSSSLKGRVAWNKGIHMSDEQKKKISISRKGKCMGNKHTLGVSPWNKGKILKKKII